ncbi:MAG: CBS domain-containing protein, partial [Desulfobacteraceae bacterium]
FGPSVVIGGALGGAVGRMFNSIMPGVVTHPGAFVVVGMAGFFAAVSNTPISTIIFVSEMTNSYRLLLPSLLVCSLAYLLSRNWTIYQKQVPSKIDSNAHLGDFFVDVLGSIRVEELMPQVRKVETVPEEMAFSAFRRVFSSTQQHYFPVVDGQGKLSGIFSINDIRSVLFNEEIGGLVLMRDIANTDIITVTPSEDLNEVMKKFTIRNLQRLPVVREDDHREFSGMLDRREVIQYYNRRVEEIKAGRHRISVDSDREVSFLKNITVRRAMNSNCETIPEDMPGEALREFFYRSKYRSFPVVDRGGRLVGVISFSDVEMLPLSGGAKGLTARDYATKNVVTVREEDSLFLALSRISQGGLAILPVIDHPVSRKVLGVVSRGDIVAGYEKALLGAGFPRRARGGQSQGQGG